MIRRQTAAFGLGLATLLFFFTTSVMAKQRKSSPGGSPPSASPQPAPEMQKLANLISGSWTTNEQFPPTTQFPNATNGRGTNVIRSGPGGFSLISDYHSVNSAGDFIGHGVITWDPKSQSYTLFWTDSAYPQPALYNGKLTGDELILTRETTTPEGQPLQVKQTWSKFTPRAFTFVQESSVAGGPLKREALVEFHRAKSRKSQRF